MKHLLLSTSLTALLLLPALSLAQWGWLGGTAISEFSDADWQVFRTTALDVFADGADGVTVDWENDQSGAHGSIKPLSTFMYEGRPCRTVAFRNFSSKGTRGQAVHTICLQDDDTWKLAPNGLEPDATDAAS